MFVNWMQIAIWEIIINKKESHMVYSFNFSKEDEVDVIQVLETKNGYVYFQDGDRKGRIEEKFFAMNFTHVEAPLV